MIPLREKFGGMRIAAGENAYATKPIEIQCKWVINAYSTYLAKGNGNHR
jgi:hypothetical protein